MHQKIILSDGTNVWLRSPTEADAPAIFEAVNSSRQELSPWMPWCHAEYSLAETETWVRNAIEAEDGHECIIMDESEERCLGSCGLSDINPRHHNANLGYWVRTSHVGQGIASAATLALANFAFSELGLVRVEIVAELKNLASQRVAENVRAKREGIVRNAIMNGENAKDAVLYSLIPEDLS